MIKSIFFNKKKTTLISYNWLEKLKILSKSSINKRSRLCIHNSTKDKVQIMLIVLDKNSNIEPHKHPLKCYVLLKGKLKITIFNRKKPVKNFELNQKNFIFWMNENKMHTVSSLSKSCTFIEIKLPN